jgi:hypothetical protein
MADAKIKVMISSQCKDKFLDSEGESLSDIRMQIAQDIKQFNLSGTELYDVWINETATENAENNAFEKCVSEAKKCDIFVALYTADPGSCAIGSEVGICQQELEAAYTQAPGKVYIIDIKGKTLPETKELTEVETKHRKDLAEKFTTYVDNLKKFHMLEIKTKEDLINAVKNIIAEATIDLVKRGVTEASRGQYHLGAPLNWTRLTYSDRAIKMREATIAALTANGVSNETANEIAVRKILDKEILFVVGAIPDAVSLAAAREMVGQPHLQDHNLCDQLAGPEGPVGPVHMIACHKTVTENQARTILGFPDATVVTGPFGIYVADAVQGIQLVLLSNCRHETNTRNQVGNFLNWLGESEQDQALVDFAVKRKAVVKVLASKDGQY